MKSEKRTIKIRNTVVGDSTGAYVIAEIGHNHQGLMEKAHELFHAAKMAGVNAVKLQKRDNKNIFTKIAYDRPYENENSFGKTYGEHREALEFGKKEYVELKALAHKLHMDFIATAFDPASADFLAEIGVDAFKIASADLRNWPLLEHVAQLKKPVIMSCGGGVFEDIKDSVEKVLKWNRNLVLLDCVMTYPSAPEDMNLRVIETLRKEFPDLVIGLSDHFNGISMAPVAFVLGARVFEKHFTINRAWKGTDQVFSLEPIGMHKMIRDLHRVQQALGDGIKKVLPQEKEAVLKMGKSIVAVRDLRKGHKISQKDVTFKSPGSGLTPNCLEEILDRKLSRPVEKDQLLALSDLSLDEAYLV